MLTLSKKSRLGEAFMYALNQWDALCYYCEDGLAGIDNNAAERALRAVTLGRKNYLNFPFQRSGWERVFPKPVDSRDVRFPIRTPEDLRELDALKEMQLNRFVTALFKQAQEEYRFSPGVFTELVKAMLKKDSPDYVTAHGAFGTFNTVMFEHGLAEEVGAAVEIYIACYPTSADYVLKSIPAKVLNYLCRYANSSDVIKWTEENPQWKEQVIASLKAGT